MEFRTCSRCHNEKTVKQFSLRNVNICKECMMLRDKSGEVQIRAYQPVLPFKFKSMIMTDKGVETSKTSTISKRKCKCKLASKRKIGADVRNNIILPTVVPINSNNQNLTSYSCNKMGITVVNNPIKPSIRGGSASYANLNEDEKRAILKAEYRIRSIKNYREKKLCTTL